MDEKLRAWQSHYQKLLNVEFPWNASNLSDKSSVEGPTIKITTEMSKAINKIKAGKGAGSSGIIIEMIKSTNNGIIDCIMSFFNHVVYKGRALIEWHLSCIINHFKGKGDAWSCGNCRGLKVQDHVMKFLRLFKNKLSIDNI